MKLYISYTHTKPRHTVIYSVMYYFDAWWPTPILCTPTTNILPNYFCRKLHKYYGLFHPQRLAGDRPFCLLLTDSPGQKDGSIMMSWVIIIRLIHRVLPQTKLLQWWGGIRGNFWTVFYSLWKKQNCSLLSQQSMVIKCKKEGRNEQYLIGLVLFFNVLYITKVPEYVPRKATKLVNFLQCHFINLIFKFCHSSLASLQYIVICLSWSWVTWHS